MAKRLSKSEKFEIEIISVNRPDPALASEAAKAILPAILELLDRQDASKHTHLNKEAA